MQSHILLIGPKAPSCLLRALQTNLNLLCSHAPNYRGALAQLSKCDFCIVLLDKNIAVTNSRASDAIFRRAGSASVIELNSSEWGDVPRVIREVRAAMNRRVHYQWRAYEVARQQLEAQLSSGLSTLLSESHNALKSAGKTEAVKFRRVIKLADSLKEDLGIA